MDSLNRDLARARDKRDALASGVATLTVQIAELEASLSAENDRRERERAANEIEGGRDPPRLSEKLVERHCQWIAGTCC